jgi:PPM family protein phosphatase
MVLRIMPYKVWACGLSDVGLVRQNNEDMWGQLPEEQFFVIADGMGGHQAGEVAARESVQALCRLLKQASKNTDKSIGKAQQTLLHLIQEVNGIIYNLGQTAHSLKGMGTTLCCIWLHPTGLIYAHVGDSRIYRFRSNKLEQLTQDHSLLQELVDMGQLNEQQAEDFIYKNIITKAIGTEPFVEPSVEIDQIEYDDLFIMCTDGLTDLLSLEDIQRVVRQTPEQEIAKHLVKLAKQRGGHDNITVVVVKVLENK